MDTDESQTLLHEGEATDEELATLSAEDKEDAEERTLRRANLRNLLVAVATIIVIILVGALPFHFIEGNTNNTLTKKMDWTYGNSIYFCVITLTTVGYGDMYPVTSICRALVIFYILIGLGILGYALTTLAEAILMAIRYRIRQIRRLNTLRTKRRLEKLMLSGSTITEASTFTEETLLSRAMRKEQEYKNLFLKHGNRLMDWFREGNRVKAFWTLTFLLILFVGGAGIFSALEGWDYGTSLYFSFITLSTVGYGDFYPDTRGGKAFCVFYVLFGLSFVAIFLGLIGESILNRTVKRFEKESRANMDGFVTTLTENILKIEKEAETTTDPKLRVILFDKLLDLHAKFDEDLHKFEAYLQTKGLDPSRRARAKAIIQSQRPDEENL
eukprot:TRINITY_DN17451_c0_g1_i1.p1 TRINITY_DN17451_c0_g1~~TRINITY_DN17451_c0_g1_i1.p1  ORF type:complete len:385 (-),score=77.62 TRINITY_DN17451_c0_g1_i1:25-1179(-)